MKKKVLNAIALCVIALVTVTAPVKAAEVPNQELLNRQNAQRAIVGSQPLIYSGQLQEYANLRAYEASRVWSHTRPDGTMFNSGNRLSSGENLAFTSGEDPIEMWLNSPSHRDNMLYPAFRYAAIGIYVAEDGTTYYAQEFAY